MKRLFKVIPILLLIVSLFSCNTTKGQVANNNATTTENAKALTLAQKEASQVLEVSNNRLASDKLQSYDEINRKYKALKLKYSKNRKDFSSDEVFANYYGLTEESDKEKYDILKARYIDSMLRYIADSDTYTGNGTIELKDLDWVNVMGRYLIRNGMSEEDLHNWYKKLTDENYSDPG